MIDIERFSETARFVRAAVEAGAHFQSPPFNTKGKKVGLDWDRNVDITLTYYFGNFEGKDNNRAFSYEEIGKIFPDEGGPLIRERVRQTVTKTVRHLYRNCSTEVQAQYDLDILKSQIGKPRFLSIKEGTSRSIAEELEVGQKYRDLYQDLTKRYYPSFLHIARRTLAPYGIIVPIAENKEKINFLTEQFQKIGPDTDKKTLQQLFGEVDQGLMCHRRDIYNKYFVGLTKLLRDLGFHFDPKSGDLSLFLERMEHFDIPFGHRVDVVKNGLQKGERNYYFVFRTQEEKISQSLLPDADLAKFLHNPIVQISGTEVNKLPNAYDLRNRKDFRGILALCRELKIRAGGSWFKVEDFLDGCPCPVFRYTNTGEQVLFRRYLYPVADQKYLADFLLKQNKAKTA